jgi:hypothetical protein
VDSQAIPVKAFANADGFPIPPGPDATTFPSNHSHYIGTANALPTEPNVDALLLNVSEHGYTDQTLFVNQTFGTTLLTGAGTTYPKFTKLPPRGVNALPTERFVQGQGTLDYLAPNNRLIGEYDGRRLLISRSGMQQPGKPLRSRSRGLTPTPCR